MSTYIYNVTAGPFHQFVPKTEDPDLNVPLRLFCRKSLVKYFEGA